MNLYITQRQAEIFLSAALTLSMTETAARLHLTQPGVSQSIAELEKHLGLGLFERIGRRLFLTYAGEILRDQLSRIDLIRTETAEKMEAIALGGVERIRVGASMTLGNYLLPRWIAGFLEEHPGVSINLEVNNTENMEAGLLSNRLDMAVVEGPTSSEMLLEETLFDDPLHLICGTGHPFSRYSEVPAAAIAGENLIMREAGSGTRSVILRELARMELPLRICHTINNIEGIKQAVAAGLGVSFLPEIAVRKERERKELVVLPVAGLRLTRTFRTLVHRDKVLSGALKAWIDYLMKVSR